MITARLAFSYEREVYALPGRVDDARSQGCLDLIREKVAEPIGSAEGLVEALGMGPSLQERRRDFVRTVQERYSPAVDPKTLWDLVAIAGEIRRTRGISLDEICRKTGLPYASVSSLTGMMEGDGVIRTDLLQRCFIDLRT